MLICGNAGLPVKIEQVGWVLGTMFLVRGPTTGSGLSLLLFLASLRPTLSLPHQSPNETTLPMNFVATHRPCLWPGRLLAPVPRLQRPPWPPPLLQPALV